MAHNSTSTYYIKDKTFRAYPFPSSYGVDRFINLSMRTYKDGTALYTLAFNHRCLDWGHCRVYEIDADTFSDLARDLSAKYGLKSAMPFTVGSYSDKYASQVMLYFELPKVRHAIGHTN